MNVPRLNFIVKDTLSRTKNEKICLLKFNDIMIRMAAESDQCCAEGLSTYMHGIIDEFGGQNFGGLMQSLNRYNSNTCTCSSTTLYLIVNFKFKHSNTFGYTWYTVQHSTTNYLISFTSFVLHVPVVLPRQSVLIPETSQTKIDHHVAG